MRVLASRRPVQCRKLLGLKHAGYGRWKDSTCPGGETIDKRHSGERKIKKTQLLGCFQIINLKHKLSGCLLNICAESLECR